MKPLKVLSCFAGIGCGEVGLERAGIKVDKIWAYEIDKYAVAVNRYNNPDTIFLGDITKWQEHIEEIGQVDLIIGGSPCQDLSIAGGRKIGLDGARSGLFYVFVDILNYYKPKWFMLENVASMSYEAKQKITRLLDVEPIKINASKVSAQSRDRYFWTNIPNVKQPVDKGIVLQDILEDNLPINNEFNVLVKGYSSAGYRTRKQGKVFEARKDNKANALTHAETDSLLIGFLDGKRGQGHRIFSINGKSVTLSSNGGGLGAKTGLYKIDKEQGYFIRKLTPIECERLMTLPDNYTRFGLFDSGGGRMVQKEISNSRRYKLLGNGWVVDVPAIAIFPHLFDEEKGLQMIVIKRQRTVEDYLCEIE